MSAANIIGIITFAYVVGAGIVLYLQRGADLVRNSIKEIKENVEAEVGFVLEVMNISGQMGHGWGESNIEGVSDHEPEMGSLEEEIKNSIAVVRTLLQQVDRDPFLHSFRNPYPTIFHRLSMTSQYIFGQKKKMVERQKLIALVRHEFEDARQKMVRLRCRQVERQSQETEQDPWSQQKRELQDIKEALRDLCSRSITLSDAVGAAMSEPHIEGSQTS